MTSRLTQIAALLADPTRAEMLLALMEEHTKTASELASIANVAPSTASHHLACLIDGGMVEVIKVGRNKYHRLAGFEVAELIERMGSLELPLRRRPSKELLGKCRSCYDHLAGSVGVALRRRLEHYGFVAEGSDCFEVTSQGSDFFRDFGIDINSLIQGRRALARACVDWTERVPHIGGSLGAALMERLRERDWIRRGAVPRQILVTPAGKRGLSELLGIVD